MKYNLTPFIPPTQRGAKHWTHVFHEYLQSKKSNPNLLLENLSKSASSTGCNFEFLWNDRMSNTLATQNSSPWPDRSTNSLQTAWTIACTVLLLLLLKCLKFSWALQFIMSKWTEKLQSSDLLQWSLPTACLKHRSSDPECGVFLRYKQYLLSRRPSEEEDEFLMNIFHIFHIHGQTKLDQYRTGTIHSST